LLLASFLLAPSVASARPWEIAAGSQVTVAKSPSFDALSEEDELVLAEMSVATRVLRHVPILGDIWVEAVGQIGSAGANDFQQFDADISLRSVQFGLRGIRQLTPRIRAYARGDVGVMFGELTLSSETAVSIRSDSDALITYGGAGIDLALLQAREDARNPDLSLGMRIEAGWLQSQAMRFRAEPDYPDDDIQHLPTQVAPLGAFDPSGLTVRIAVVGRF
jgi:hypothetical protein